MTLRDDLLPVFQNVARQIPVDLGLRTVTVSRLILEWDGGYVGAGEEVVVDTLTITPAPKVRAGKEPNTLNVGPITPRFGVADGYTPDDLNPLSLEAAQTCEYEIAGPQTTERYRLVDINTTRAFGYTLILESLDRKPPTSV